MRLARRYRAPNGALELNTNRHAFGITELRSLFIRLMGFRGPILILSLVRLKAACASESIGRRKSILVSVRRI